MDKDRLRLNNHPLARIERDVTILQWMVGANITLQVLVLGLMLHLQQTLAAIAAKIGVP
jgi:hypothetical protein